ncbi:MAG: radical SAM protein [Candidatus Nanoarchaeia archaeon]|jgi:radical SAM superfamily enzyme YgiQ (UPF0313 family)|nr:radical SAM protein [Candidatus Nanoarchaeia archaeon]|tara:strand:- start:42688 stop:44145 length:1458 start_codon:yes stop_codon:yes gene_type:complete
MKVLLIMPSMDSGYWRRLGKKVGPKSEPLSLAYIGAMLKKHNHEVKILDCEALDYSFEEVEDYLKKNEFDVVGIAMITIMYSQTMTICKLVKKMYPKAKIIVGGPHPSAHGNAKEILETEFLIDYCVVGEAEKTFVELLNLIENKKEDHKELLKVNGISYRNNEEVMITRPRDTVKELDEFPIPDRSLLNMSLYRPTVSYYRKLPAYIILTSRGCGYRCTFCSKVFDKEFRYHSPERVVEEMKILVEEHGAKEIVFRDDTFTMKFDWTKEVCEKIIESNLNKKVKWSCMTRVSLVNPELLRLMKEAGCWGIHFGVESGSQRLLDMIKKDVTIKQIKDAFKWCREIGIESRAFMMIGLPTETRDESLKTINFAKELDPDWAQFTITTPYPGTELYDQVVESGELNSKEWDNYQTWGGFSDHELVWVPKGRTSEELKTLQRKALFEFYFRPKIILRKITNISNFALFKKYILGAMALASGGSGRPIE